MAMEMAMEREMEMEMAMEREMEMVLPLVDQSIDPSSREYGNGNTNDNVEVFFILGCKYPCQCHSRQKQHYKDTPSKAYDNRKPVEKVE